MSGRVLDIFSLEQKKIEYVFAELCLCRFRATRNKQNKIIETGEQQQ